MLYKDLIILLTISKDLGQTNKYNLITDIPAYDQDFWSDIDNMIAKEMPSNELPHPVQPEPQPIQEFQPVPQAPQVVPPAPKKRKLSLKKKDNQ